MTMQPKAIIYLRTPKPQKGNTAYIPQVHSIQAQRDACQQKADQLGIVLIALHTSP